MLFWFRHAAGQHVKTVDEMKNLWLAFALFIGSGSILFGNGGAWQTGVPGTGSASASNKNRQTNVTIEDETLKIDLHPDYAEVGVHYRMHNTGRKVEQEFFFPVERWGKNPDADTDAKDGDIDGYHISVDGRDLKWTNVSAAKEEGSEMASGQFWQQDLHTIKSWKKSVIPFERNQTRDVAIS